MAEVLKINAKSPDPMCIEYAADMIRRGHVISVPTDTFYGLAADPYNLYAVEEIFQIKGRASQKPILLLVSSVEQAEALANGDLPDKFYSLARRFWPGPLTLVIPASSRVPLKITGNTGKVAVRLPNCKVALSLIRALETPLTGTSANLAGLPECASAAEVEECLGDRVSLILDGGDSDLPIPSTIVEVTPQGGWRLIREGAVPIDQIADIMAA